MAVKIITDSSADLPIKWIREYDITIVPLNVHFGEEEYKDGIEIWSAEFYNRIKNEPIVPNTSHPSPDEFLKVFQSKVSLHDAVIGIFISQEMSGTVDSARLGAKMLESDYQVEIIDSRFVSMALGLIVIKAARMAQQNADVAQIISAIHTWQKQITVYFTLNSLEYLNQTGRIGKASSLLGSLLNIKPILSIEDGVIVPAEQARGNFQKIATIMVDKLLQKYGTNPLMISVLHTETPEVA
jgi:DegV family protein with EDD domain